MHINSKVFENMTLAYFKSLHFIQMPSFSLMLLLRKLLVAALGTSCITHVFEEQKSSLSNSLIPHTTTAQLTWPQLNSHDHSSPHTTTDQLTRPLLNSHDHCSSHTTTAQLTRPQLSSTHTTTAQLTSPHTTTAQLNSHDHSSAQLTRPQLSSTHTTTALQQLR